MRRHILISAIALTAAGLTSSDTVRAAQVADSSGLMIHVPFDGSFEDARALGAVRAEAQGKPQFSAGTLGSAATPGEGQSRVGRLHVSRLSRIMLRGRTPGAGTISFWFRPWAKDSARAADTTATVLLCSDAPLDLEITVAGSPPRLSATFADDAGAGHRIEGPLPSPFTAPWWPVALCWDAANGVIALSVAGEPIVQAGTSSFRMPGLPKIFDLGTPGFSIDDFRLYNRLLDPAALRNLAGR